MYHTTNDKENNKIIFEKIVEIKKKAQQKLDELIENFKKKPNLNFRAKMLQIYEFFFGLGWCLKFCKRCTKSDYFMFTCLKALIFFIFFGAILYVYTMIGVVFFIFGNFLFCCYCCNYEIKWFLEWYKDIKKNNPELLPQTIDNNIYDEMKNFAQTLHDEYNLNVTVIKYNYKEIENSILKNYYRFALRIYNNNAVLPSTPKLKFSAFTITLNIIKFNNFFNGNNNLNNNLNTNFNNNLNNNLTIFNNINVNYINNSNNNSNNINNLNNFDYLNIPIAIAEIV
jgi:hypothetical protein